MEVSLLSIFLAARPRMCSLWYCYKVHGYVLPELQYLQGKKGTLLLAHWKMGTSQVIGMEVCWLSTAEAAKQSKCSLWYFFQAHEQSKCSLWYSFQGHGYMMLVAQPSAIIFKWMCPCFSIKMFNVLTIMYRIWEILTRIMREKSGYWNKKLAWCLINQNVTVQFSIHKLIGLNAIAL